MSLDLYYTVLSPPSRSVLMLAKALKLKVNLKQLDLHKGEHLKPDFLKLNPQHTVPTLVDSNFPLSESRVILIYLVQKYARTDALYPKDPKDRALVNHRLYLDLDVMYQGIRNYYIPQLLYKKPADPEKYKQIEEAFKLLDTFIDVGGYVAGSKISIADYSLVASVSSYDAVGFDMTNYKNVQTWYVKMQSAAGYEENVKGYDQLKGAWNLM